MDLILENTYLLTNWTFPLLQQLFPLAASWEIVAVLRDNKFAIVFEACNMVHHDYFIVHISDDLCMTIFPALFIGRFFDFHILDMIELGIDKFVSQAEFPVCCWRFSF